MEREMERERMPVYLGWRERERPVLELYLILYL
jgi:hypothetical protein